MFALIPLITSLAPGQGSVLLYATRAACEAQMTAFSRMDPRNTAWACVPAYMDPKEFDKALKVPTDGRNE